MRSKKSNHGGHSNHSNHGGGRSNGGRPRKFRSGGGGGGGGGNDSQSLARQKKAAMTQKEKYLNMARDALSNGDRVEAEYYFQHVEHYSRVIGEIIAKEPPSMRERPEHNQDDHEEEGNSQNEPRAGNDNGYDDEADDSDDTVIPLPASILPDSDDLDATAANS